MVARLRLGMTDARMPGRVAPDWCPHCRATPGPDCPTVGRTPRQVRRTEQRDTARLIREETTTVKPETHAYLDANRDPKFFSGEPDYNSITVTTLPDGGVTVIVDDYPDDVGAHLLNRAETVRLRDWLTAHLGDNPDTGMAECVAHMVGEDRRTVAAPYCGWCGNDHLADIAQPSDAAAPPAPPGTTVELSGSGDWMWTCDHRDCSTELNPGGWFGIASGGFTSELSARQGLASHLADVHPTQMGGWPDPDEEPDAGTP